MSKELKLELDKETAKGTYANMALIVHSKDEFIIDFALNYPGRSAQVNSRIITSPQHAKALMKSLEKNIRRYEAQYGELPEAKPRPSGEQN